MRRLPVLFAVVLFAMGADCSPEGEVKGTQGSSSSTTSGTNGGGGNGGGNGGGGNGGTTTSGGNGGVDTGASGTFIPDTVDCDEVYDTPAPSGCVTDTIACGETIYANNLGGSTQFEADGQFEQCSGTASGDDFAGPERVYRFDAPAGTNSVHVQVDSCRRTWLLWYQGSQQCPSTDELVTCSYPPGYGNSFNSQGEDIIVGPGGTIWFVVEGYQNDGGNFAITVDCY